MTKLKAYFATTSLQSLKFAFDTIFPTVLQSYQEFSSEAQNTNLNKCVDPGTYLF
jgi:hypothetical protein